MFTRSFTRLHGYNKLWFCWNGRKRATFHKVDYVWAPCALLSVSNPGAMLISRPSKFCRLTFQTFVWYLQKYIIIFQLMIITKLIKNASCFKIRTHWLHIKNVLCQLLFELSIACTMCFSIACTMYFPLRALCVCPLSFDQLLDTVWVTFSNVVPGKAQLDKQIDNKDKIEKWCTYIFSCLNLAALTNQYSVTHAPTHTIRSGLYPNYD